MLYGLTEENDIVSKILKEQGLNNENVIKKIKEIIGEGNDRVLATAGLTPRSKKVIENAFKEAKKNNTDYIGTEHLIIGLLKEGDSIAVRIILDLNINVHKMYNEVAKITNKSDENINYEVKNSKKEYNTNSALYQYGTNLSKLALEGKLDPVIGREKEIERIIQILSRRTKNNPCLIGEPGVGKTAVVEGLAIEISLGNVPDILIGKKVISLDISRNGSRSKV